MKNIIKTFSLLAIFALIPGAFAASATRVSVRGQPSTRGSSLSIAGKVRAIAANTTYSNASTTQWFSSAECVENYTTCLKDSGVCGSDLEECTNTVLLHGKMPACLTVLTQCKDADVANLFGSGANISNLYTVPADGGKNSAGEVIKYTYPTNTSILGQMIESAAITNRFSASQCVKKYTSCLNKDSVCGEDFELCTSQKEFKKNAIMCEATLARCQNDGKVELFGANGKPDSLAPATGSRLDDMIKAGAQLAATNTLATCNKVADQCILKACTQNPTRCLEGKSNAALVAAVDLLKSEYGDTLDPSVLGSLNKDADDLTKSTKADVKKFIKGTCLEVIGSNKYCYIVHKAIDNDSKVKSADIANILGNENFKVGEDDVADVFESIYGNRMNDATKKKIQDLADAFDTKAKDACSDTITECAMMSCGGGLGSLCYKKVFLNGSSSTKISTLGTIDMNNTINGERTRPEILKSCEAVVNTNKNCLYSYAVLNDEQYNYNYINSGAFNTLFPESTTGTDPIGVIGRLNAALATSYNEAAIENMRKQCANTAMACVKSVCGADYVNCYRNRTDVRLTGAGSYRENVEGSSYGFAKSMDKVGGVLDYNIVTGLCMNTIKNASACEEHLKIAAAEFRDADMKDGNSWSDGTKQYGSVRDAWLDSNKTKSKFTQDQVLAGCKVSPKSTDPKFNVLGTTIDICSSKTDMQECETVDDNGCYYSEPVYVNTADYVLEKSATSLFQQVLMDVEREVQMTYNAKLTREQNMCTQRNEGGVRGKNDTGSTYMWVKLKKSKVPANYSMTGLNANDFTATGDLYGAFCRVRVNLISDDKFLQQALSESGESTEAYFAVGDTFTCGSWLSQKQLDTITKSVREHAELEAKGYKTDKNGNPVKYTAKDSAALAWATVGSFLVGGIGSYFGMDAAQRKGNSLGGLLGHNITTKRTDENKAYANTCLSEIAKARQYKAIGGFDNWTKAVDSANSAVKYARLAGVNNITTQSVLETVAVTKKDKTSGDLTVVQEKWVNPETGEIEDRNKTKQVINNQLHQGSITPFVYGNITGGYAGDCEWDGADQLKVLAGGFAKSTDETCKGMAKNVLEMLSRKPTKEMDEQTYQDLLFGCDLTNSDTIANKTLKATCVGTVAATDWSTFAGTDGKGTGASNEYKNFETQLSALETECQLVAAGDRYDYANDPKKYLLNNMMAGLAGSAVTTALGAGIAKTVIDIKYENIQDEAAKKWMEEIGSHIQCVIGTDEAGSFGDTVTIDYEY